MPPDTGIVHQVNLEYLARVVFVNDDARRCAYPDTLVGTDSHTTMINGLGVLGWGVGGIEAEAAMLGQPMSMLIPQVVGFKLTGELPEGATATDLVLTVTEMLRKNGVVGKFVEFFGAGVSRLPLADRATIGNMSPEYGATCAIFPIDAETLRYLRVHRPPARSRSRSSRRTRRSRASGTTSTARSRPTPTRSSSTSATVVPCIAGPKRPQDRIALTDAQEAFRQALAGYVPDRRRRRRGRRHVPGERSDRSAGSRRTATAAREPHAGRERGAVERRRRRRARRRAPRCPSRSPTARRRRSTTGAS